MERLVSAAGRPELEQYADGFVAWLGRLGYSPRTCEAQVALLRHLARWLAEQRVPLSGLGGEVAGEYAAVRRGRSHLRSARALQPLLSYTPARGQRHGRHPEIHVGMIRARKTVTVTAEDD